MIVLLALLLGLVPIHGLVIEMQGESQRDRSNRSGAEDDAGADTPLYARSTGDTSVTVRASMRCSIPRRSRPTLRDAVPAAIFAPGLPDSGARRSRAARRNLTGGHADRSERQLPSRSIARSAGKTLLLSFVFTRCPDRTLCPAISGKFAYLQSRLDPKRFALAEITLDPPYDSPAVLRAYGSLFGAKRESWALLTGTGSTIQRLLDEFRISSMRVSDDNFLHNDKLFIATPSGRDRLHRRNGELGALRKSSRRRVQSRVRRAIRSSDSNSRSSPKPYRSAAAASRRGSRCSSSRSSRS